MTAPLEAEAVPAASGDRGSSAAAPRAAAVELRGVVKRYGDVTAVRDATLFIQEGEFFSLLGPSGCGKTTTLQPDRRVRASRTRARSSSTGRPMVGTPPHRRPVNTVFQSYALFPHMTVAENIAFGLRMKRAPARRDPRARVGQMLELDVAPRARQTPPAQLSGGQQQRVALARALVDQPAVLLLDEPLGSLDAKLRQQMQLELARIQREVGITFVYVTHDQEEAMAMSDRLAVMDGGQVVQVGSPRAVYEMPATRFVADFIGSSNIAGRAGWLRSTRRRRPCGSRAASTCASRAAAGLDPGAAAAVVVRPDRLDIVDGPAPAGERRHRARDEGVLPGGAPPDRGPDRERPRDHDAPAEHGRQRRRVGARRGIDRPRHVVRRPLPRVCGMAGRHGSSHDAHHGDPHAAGRRRAAGAVPPRVGARRHRDPDPPVLHADRHRRGLVRDRGPRVLRRRGAGGPAHRDAPSRRGPAPDQKHAGTLRSLWPYFGARGLVRGARALGPPGQGGGPAGVQAARRRAGRGARLRVDRPEPDARPAGNDCRRLQDRGTAR